MEEITEEEYIRYIGEMIFIDEHSSEVNKRKTMIQYENVLGYDEFVHEEFVEYGKTTNITMYDQSNKIVLESFNNFQKKHDRYLRYNKKQNIILKRDN